MYEIAQYLDGFGSRLTLAQYCTGDQWEQAAKLDLDNKPAPVDGTSLDGTVAIEAFYQLGDSRNVFLGIRYARGLRRAPTPVEFLQKAIDVIYEGPLTIQDLFGQLGDTLNADAETYLGRPVENAKVGVTNFWHSEGPPVVVRSASEPLATSELLETRLRQNQSLLANNHNYTALAFEQDEPPQAWLAIQVGRQGENGLYRTDLQAATALANMV